MVFFLLLAGLIGNQPLVTVLQAQHQDHKLFEIISCTFGGSCLQLQSETLAHAQARARAHFSDPQTFPSARAARAQVRISDEAEFC